MNTEAMNSLCPCESGKTYKTCCCLYIEQEADAPSPEVLMRSRYTAYIQMNEAYLRYSWHPDTCPLTLELDQNTKWLGLKIKRSKQQAEDTVEFVARYKINGKGFRLHETSRFIQYQGRWTYLDGIS